MKLLYSYVPYLTQDNLFARRTFDLEVFIQNPARRLNLLIDSYEDAALF